MNAVVRPIDLPPGRRVLVVSDIHGNLPFLRGVLAKAGFCKDDILIVLGDILERNEGSLDALRYVMELSKTHTIHTILGNCDNITPSFIDHRGDIPEAFFHGWFSRLGEKCLLVKMAHLAGVGLDSGADYAKARAVIAQQFREELDFLRSLPHIYVNRDYLFVHGGVPREDRLEGLDAFGCMKNDDFLGQGHAFRRWVVVGHWPVTLYDPHIQCANPLLHQARHIASIDGGCVLKLDGQLNALVIPDINGDRLETASYDDFPLVTALEAQQPCENSLNIRWSDSVVEVLAEGGDCVFIRHPTSGRTMWLPRDYVSVWQDGKTHTEDATDYRLPVAAGDRLSLVRRTQRGCLVKKGGITGWYLGQIQFD